MFNTSDKQRKQEPFVEAQTAQECRSQRILHHLIHFMDDDELAPPHERRLIEEVVYGILLRCDQLIRLVH